MGLDIALGLLVLLAGIRGWLRGFWFQAIQLGAAIGCVYLADPLRDVLLPHVREAFPAIQEELLGKLLWWGSVVVGYMVLNGVPASLVRLYRRRPETEFESRWKDSGAGFLLGLAKGAVSTAFLIWAIEAYAVPRYAKSPDWVGQQLTKSRALELARVYHPAERIWNTGPVQAFVGRIKDRGFQGRPGPVEEGIERPPTINARSTPKTVPASLPAVPLSVPQPPLDPQSPSFLLELDQELRHQGIANPR